MSRFLSEAYKGLEVYTPGEQLRDRSYIKLNTNEFPYPPHPDVVAAAAKAAETLELYSDPTCAALRDAIAEKHGLRRENVYVASGSDDILDFAFMVFAGRGRKAYFPDITYGFYPVFAALHGIECERVPLRDDFSVDLSDYAGLRGLIVLANPNAPTGMALGRDQIEALVASHPDDVVLIDEAYVDFGSESCVPLTKTYDNLLVVQTFSKSRAMAGARLGFAMASEGLIGDLDRIKYSTNPYNVNSMTLAAGACAIAHDDYYMGLCAQVAATRDQTAARLRDMGFEVLPSRSNFLFARSDRVGGEALYRRLREKGILVRHFTAPRIADYNRITIGTPEQMDAVVRAISEILEG